MTTATLHTPVPQTEMASPLTHGVDAERSVRTPSIAAGVGPLLMSVLSGFGYLIAVRGLVTEGNASRIAEQIATQGRVVRALLRAWVDDPSRVVKTPPGLFKRARERPEGVGGRRLRIVSA